MHIDIRYLDSCRFAWHGLLARLRGIDLTSQTYLLRVLGVGLREKLQRNEKIHIPIHVFIHNLLSGRAEPGRCAVINHGETTPPCFARVSNAVHFTHSYKASIVEGTANFALLYIPSRKPLPRPIFVLETPCTCRSYRVAKSWYLVLVLIGLVVDDVEEAELVHTLGGGDDAEPVTELLLLEELLGTA